MSFFLIMDPNRRIMYLCGELSCGGADEQPPCPGDGEMRELTNAALLGEADPRVPKSSETGTSLKYVSITEAGGEEGGEDLWVESSCDEGEEGDEHPPAKRPRLGHCFGCEYVFPYNGVLDGAKIDELTRFVEENYGRMHIRVLARICHLMFKETIYEPMRKAGKEIPMWTSRAIIAHLVNHLRIPRVFLHNSIDKLNRVQTALEGMLFREDRSSNGTRTVRPVPENFRLFVLVNKRLLDLFKEQPKKMNALFTEGGAIEFVKGPEFAATHGRFTFG